jgi:iron complex transport system substrate-binding protein
MRVARNTGQRLALLGGLLLMSLACSAAEAAAPLSAQENTVARQVIDDASRSVSVSGQPTRIADGWYAHHALLMTLGAGPCIVATVNHPRSQPWMFKVLPSLEQATQIDGTAFNVEDLLADHVDLVFTSIGDRQALAYEQVGLPVMRMGFTDLAGLQRSMLATAQALGGEQAMDRAQAYNRYLDAQLSAVKDKVSALSIEQRPTVLHIASINPLKVDGSDTLIDDWIRIAGGRNAAIGLKGNMQVVSAEQVLAWQPDVLILAAGAGDLEQAAQGPLGSLRHRGGAADRMGCAATAPGSVSRHGHAGQDQRLLSALLRLPANRIRRPKDSSGPAASAVASQQSADGPQVSHLLRCEAVLFQDSIRISAKHGSRKGFWPRRAPEGDGTGETAITAHLGMLKLGDQRFGLALRVIEHLVDPTRRCARYGLSKNGLPLKGAVLAEGFMQLRHDKGVVKCTITYGGETCIAGKMGQSGLVTQCLPEMGSIRGQVQEAFTGRMDTGDAAGAHVTIKLLRLAFSPHQPR